MLKFNFYSVLGKNQLTHNKPAENEEAESRKLKVLLIIEADIATTQLVEQILCHLKELGLSYRKRLLVDLELSDFSNGELPLIVRSCDPLLGYWVRVWMALDIPFVFYLDDNFWEIEGDSALARYYKQPLVRKTLDLVVAQASCVLTNSELLANYLCEANNAVEVVPATFSFQLIDGVESYTGSERRIGFAGSPSRAKDLEIIAPIIHPLLSRYPDLIIEFVGVLPNGISPHHRIRFFPHVASYEDYIHFQVKRGWLVGWAPLFDTIANRSKTNNKYREYSACRIAGIYTKIPPYKDSVQANRTGLLVGNQPEEWLVATEVLLNDVIARNAMADSAYSDVYEKHSLTAVAGEWMKILKKSHRDMPASFRRYPCFRFKALYLVQQIWIQIDMSYQEGGIRLVLKRAAARLSRIFAA